jgi:5-methylcytosine-specific restriction endonuclease McrA
MKRSPLRRRKPMRRLKRHPQIRIFRDGRETLSGAAWRQRKLDVFLRDGGCCVGCGKFLTPPGRGLPNEAEIHHCQTRGMSGSKRDDRIQNLETLCHACHEKVTAKPEWSKKGL